MTLAASLRLILMALLIIMASPTNTSAETINEWTINMQDKADNYARWLDHPPKRRNAYGDALIMRKFIYTCTMLKAYSINDWCDSSSLTKRWIGYARQHGFDVEVRGYKQTTFGNFRFPENILQEIRRANEKKR
jgi:hypothetical protein